MKDLIDTGYLKIVVNPEKQRTYCTMQGFWKNDEERMKRLPDILRQHSQCMPRQGTVILDTTALRIMHPHVAELFIPAFTKCLLGRESKALARVEDPENMVLRLQFERVLSNVEGVEMVRRASFNKHGTAELWLDRQS